MSAATGQPREQLVAFLAEMLLIRRFEEKVTERFRAGELAGFLHAAIGQEAVAVGVCGALEDDDVISSTHRAHGHVLANGTPANEVMAELYGKVECCSHGYGGSMHLYDVELGTMGANAVVGGELPATVGATAFGVHALQVDGQDAEAVHLAALDALAHAREGRGPVLVVCETERLTGHYIGDPQVYRDKNELRELRETRDPIENLRARLELTDEEWAGLDAEANGVVEAAVEFAKAGSDPEPQHALRYVYVEER
jgi:acetoin:2,6-dichlorophenolindophenol oxidoreductase subunit alpha